MCTFTIEVVKQSIMLVQSDLLLSQEEFLKGISETYRDLFISKKYADVTLVTDDKLHIPAHRFILSKLNVTLVTPLEG